MKINFYTQSIMPRYYLKKSDVFSMPEYAVSFGALKKSQFKGTDLLVVNQLKAPIEKFKSQEDFQSWCNNEINKLNKNFPYGRGRQTNIQRKQIIQSWSKYLSLNNFPNSQKLFICSSLWKDLQQDDDKLPPFLNEDILKNTINECNSTVNTNPKLQINFIRTYCKNLEDITLSKLSLMLDNEKTGWVEIPSIEHDSENFEKNVELIKLLSHHNWCTRMFYAHPYLEKGDFHIYLEKGKPKLGVRFSKEEVGEIQGELNNSKIPLKYSEIAKKHLAKYSLSFKTEDELNEIETAQKKIEEFKAHFANGIENAPVKEILQAFSMKVEEDKNGMLTIKGNYFIPIYNGPYYTLEDLGINENILFKKIRKIEGNVDFQGSKLKSLGNLEYIGGSASFKNSNITNLGNLSFIGENADFSNSKIKALGNLCKIGGNADFSNSKISNLGKLEFIGGIASFYNTKYLKNTGNLKYIGDNAIFWNSQICDLKKLEYVGGSINLKNSKITKIPNLKFVKKFAYIDSCTLIPQLSEKDIEYGFI